MIFHCFVFQKSGTVCMLFVPRFVVIVDVDDVVMIIVPLLPFVCDSCS